eukprot:tig00020554_g10814.t1
MAGVAGEAADQPVLASCRVLHEALHAEFDIVQRRVAGYADIKFALTQPVEAVNLNARSSCRIITVQVDGAQAEYSLDSPLDRPLFPTDADTLGELNASKIQAGFAAAVQAASEGEVCVQLPAASISRVASALSAGTGSSGPPLEATVTVRVYFESVRPPGGIFFVDRLRGSRASANTPASTTFLFTDGEFGNASLWMPCVERVEARHPWHLEIALPASASLVAPSPPNLQRRAGPLALWSLDVRESVAASELVLAAGPFAEHADSAAPALRLRAPVDSAPLLPAALPVASATLQVLSEYAGVKPANALSAVFLPVEGLRVSGLSVCLLDATLLTPGVETSIALREELPRALAGAALVPLTGAPSWREEWVAAGLRRVVGDTCVAAILGRNHVAFALAQERSAVLERPHVLSDPASDPLTAAADLHGPKAALVLRCIEARLGFDAFKAVVRRLLGTDGQPGPSASASASAGASHGGQQSARALVRAIKKCTGMDMKKAVEGWAARAEAPEMTCGYVYNRKRHSVMLLVKPRARFRATLTVRIYESSGNFEHAINIRELDEIQSFELPVQTKFQPRRRQRKHKAGEPDAGAGPDGPDEKETEGDGQSEPSSSGVYFVRVDPAGESIVKATVNQVERAWRLQLKRDNDVASQLAAIAGLQQAATTTAVQTLHEAVQAQWLFHGVRAAAAAALAAMSREENGFVGVSYLQRYFRRHFIEKESGFVAPVKFSPLTEYFALKGVLAALPHARHADGTTLADPMDLLTTTFLKGIDNSANEEDDSFLVAAALGALAACGIPPALAPGQADGKKDPREALRSRVLQTAKRFVTRAFDLPSPWNVVICACLQVFARLEAGKVDFKEENFFAYLASQHANSVRAAAVAALLRVTADSLLASDAKPASKPAACARAGRVLAAIMDLVDGGAGASKKDRPAALQRAGACFGLRLAVLRALRCEREFLERQTAASVLFPRLGPEALAQFAERLVVYCVGGGPAAAEARVRQAAIDALAALEALLIPERVPPAFATPLSLPELHALAAARTSLATRKIVIVSKRKEMQEGGSRKEGGDTRIVFKRPK